MLQALVLTLFPEMFPGVLGYSLSGKALREGIWELHTLHLREFAPDKHKTVDDTPYGGGAGMVMKPDILATAINAAKAKLPYGKLVHFSPRGKLLTQSMVAELCDQALILLCSRFEGVDQRVLDAYQPLEISLGDYILSGGEMAALTLLDACVRLNAGVMGSAHSAHEESFTMGEKSARLLEYPHYTKPPIWNGVAVPPVLLSGNHAKIHAWRMSQAEEITKTRRPDLWEEISRALKNGPSE